MTLPSSFSLRAIYFLYFGSLGSLLPFLSILFNERGISATKIGAIMMVLPLCNLIIPPLWGLLADATGSRLLILRLALFGAAGCTLLLIPHYSFWVTMAVMIAFGIFRSPLTSLLDAITHAHLSDRLDEFGRYRLWGSLGFLIAAGLFGRLRDTLGETNALGITAALLLACTLSALLLRPVQSPIDKRRPVIEETINHLKSRSVQLFVAGVAIYYFAHSLFDAYVGLHFKSLGYSDSFIGFAWAFGVAVEVALMAFSPKIFKYCTPTLVISASAIAATLRWSILSVVTSKMGILLQQPLHALTFGLWYLGCAKWIQSRAPEHLRASLQSVMISSMGLGMLGGYVVGGRAYDLYGGSLLYTGAAIIAFISSLLFISLRKLEAK